MVRPTKKFLIEELQRAIEVRTKELILNVSASVRLREMANASILSRARRGVCPSKYLASVVRTLLEMCEQWCARRVCYCIVSLKTL